MAWSTLPALIFALSALTLTATANPDIDALSALRRSLNDPDNVLQSWDASLVNPCMVWFHIACDQDNNRVTRLNLQYLNLSGSLVPELGNMEGLQYLDAHGNNIQGPIPQEIGNLKNLRSLDLYNNDITGSIPSTLGNLNSLLFLRVNDNRLTGTIPNELTAISSLAVFDVSNNDLCGPIPTTGPFERIPPSSFVNNPRLGGPCP